MRKAAPKGWYTGRCSENTMRLIAEDGSFEYVSDDYADDLPYWTYCAETPQLVIPYTLDANDMRFNALVRVFRAASDEQRLGVLNAHPDLAGKLAAAKRLTAESTSEQASAGLDALTDRERDAFTELNAKYTDKFGFPFIIAVRDHYKASIMAAFQERLENSHDAEFAQACYQVERIAFHRLKDMLP